MIKKTQWQCSGHCKHRCDWVWLTVMGTVNYLYMCSLSAACIGQSSGTLLIAFIKVWWPDYPKWVHTANHLLPLYPWINSLYSVCSTLTRFQSIPKHPIPSNIRWMWSSPRLVKRMLMSSIQSPSIRGLTWRTNNQVQFVVRCWHYLAEEKSSLFIS